MDDDVWADLIAAHKMTQPHIEADFPVHAPRAAVLSCSDARVPPSLMFGQPAGALFMVRLAGNSPTPAVLASLDFAVKQLGVGLIVVLGHTGCGAVDAVVSGAWDDHLAPIVDTIAEIAKANPDATVEQLVELNVEHAVDSVLAHAGPAGVAARAGEVQLRGAVHDLRNGELVLVGAEGYQIN